MRWTSLAWLGFVWVLPWSFEVSAEAQELVQFRGSDTTSGDEFGAAVAQDGALALLGAPRDDDSGVNAGTAFLFDLSNAASPVELAKLRSTQPVGGEHFGNAVALRAERALVAAFDPLTTITGAAYTFDTGNPEAPVPLARLRPVGSATTGEAFGASVALSEPILHADERTPRRLAVVGAPDDSMRGAVYFFDADTGVQLAVVRPAGVMTFFGCALAIEGTTLAVGAYGDNERGVWAGAVFVYDFADFYAPVLRRKLTAPDGEDLDRLGASVAIDRGVVLAGAWGGADNGAGSGAAYVFRASTGEYLAKLVPADGAAGDRFGATVSLSAGNAVIGAPFASSGGRAYLFDVPMGVEIARLLASNPQVGTDMGRGVSVLGNVALIGRPHATWGVTQGGSALVFDLPPRLVVSACHGDACPCSNEAPSAGGCRNSLNLPGRLEASGSTSLTTADLRLTVSQLPPDTPVVVYMGDRWVNDLLGDGRQCVLGTTLRLRGGATTSGPVGFVRFDDIPDRALGWLQPGERWYFQCWYSDPNGPCLSLANTTNAVGATFVP